MAEVERRELSSRQRLLLITYVRSYANRFAPSREAYAEAQALLRLLDGPGKVVCVERQN